jgi:hypothetical protein
MEVTPELIKTENEGFLHNLGIKVNPALPVVESKDEVRPRSTSDVGKRACALSFTIRLGYGYPIEQAKGQLQSLDLWNVLGSHEKKVLESGDLTEQDKINFGWQAECVQVLAWALNKANLDHTVGCDDDLADKIPFEDGVKEFIDNAKLRPIEEIQQQVDLIYRMHWYTVHCRLNGIDCILNEGIIKERRRAFDWMYGVEEDWDEVPMDT